MIRFCSVLFPIYLQSLRIKEVVMFIFEWTSSSKIPYHATETNSCREERDNDESIDFSSSQAVDVLSSGSLKEVCDSL